MEQPTVLGYMREQPERLAYVFDHREEFVQPFVEVIKKYDIKKSLICDLKTRSVSIAQVGYLH